jgi:hypothetical protein
MIWSIREARAVVEGDGSRRGRLWRRVEGLDVGAMVGLVGGCGVESRVVLLGAWTSAESSFAGVRLGCWVVVFGVVDP